MASVRWVLLACATIASAADARPVDVRDFGSTAAGAPARLFTLTNRTGMTLSFSDWGGVVTRIDTPDRTGRLANVVLGFATLSDYERKNAGYRFGAPIGRYANRIGGARLVIDGRRFTLAANDGPNILHSGSAPGYDMRLWSVTPFDRGRESGAVLRLVSPDGDQGFPGTLSIEMTYRLTDRNEFRIDYAATTSAATVVNLTHHDYFNLAGTGGRDVLDHLVQVQADRVAEVDAARIPTGRIVPVSGGLDLRRATRIGDGIANDPAIKAANGYDHPFVLAGGPGLRPVASLREPSSGRTLTVLTAEPSMQVYTANHLTGKDRDSAGQPFVRHGGVALETQHLPDSPNQPGFPSTLLRPGQVFRSTTVYRFRAE